MDKHDLLKNVGELAAQSLITKEEVLRAFEGGAAMEKIENKKVGVSEILYGIGGFVVVLGISIFVGQNWQLLSVVTRILATFGSAVAAYVVGVIFMRHERFQTMAQAFFLISGIVFPVGLGVIFDNAGYDLDSSGVQSLLLFALTAVFGASFALMKRDLFLFFTIFFGTGLFFTFTNFLVQGNPALISEYHFNEYRSLLVGVSYSVLGYGFAKTKKGSIISLLYTVGSISFLGAAFSLGGYSPNQNVFWEVVFPGLVFGIIFLSVYIKNKAFLVVGSLFLMAFILKITAEYFKEGLGWPLALVLAGLMLISVGYLTVFLNKKYIKS